MRELCNGKERNFERGLSKDERKNQKALFRMFLKTAEVGQVELAVDYCSAFDRRVKDHQKLCAWAVDREPRIFTVGMHTFDITYSVMC